jgi:hypothetical protein
MITATDAPRATELRDTAPFDRLEVHDPANEVDVIVEPGDRQHLAIEGPPEIVARVRTVVIDRTLMVTLAGGLSDRLRDAVTTSLTRHHVTYRITTPRLLEVRVAGLVRVAIEGFGSNRPVVTSLEPHPPAMPRSPAPG